MSPYELLASLRTAEFALCVYDGKLFVSPHSKLSSDQKEAIRSHKDALVAILATEGKDAPFCPWCNAEKQQGWVYCCLCGKRIAQAILTSAGFDWASEGAGKPSIAAQASWRLKSVSLRQPGDSASMPN